MAQKQIHKDNVCVCVCARAQLYGIMQEEKCMQKLKTNTM